MASTTTMTTATAARTRTPGLDLTGPVPAVLALAGCGVFAASLPPVSDHAWQFYMAERALDGARLYIDVGAADMHPPLFTWLAMAIAAIGRVVHVSGLTLYPVFVLCTVAATLFAWWRLAPRSGWMAAVIVAALLPMAGPYYGQGEHVALVFALPYLAGAARTAQGRPLGRSAALAVALAAGIGLAMKPHFALVWVGVEAWLATRRGMRSLLRAESITIGTVFVLYVVASLLLTPTLFQILPWLLRLYPQFAPVPFSSIILDGWLILLVAGLVAGWTVRRDERWAPLAHVLGITASAMYVALLLQGKGWGYHWYPVSALSLILCGLAIRPYLDRLRMAAPALALLAAFWMHAQADRTTRLLVTDPVMLPQLMDVVERHAAGRSIVAYSHLLQTAFPLVNLTATRWASPYAHLWMLPAMYADAWAGREPVRYRDTGEWAALEQQILDRLWAQFELDRPAIIILHAPLANGFDVRTWLESDERFAASLAATTTLTHIGRYVVVRTD